jgi:uncharacterized protein (TIGR02996 family)
MSPSTRAELLSILAAVKEAPADPAPRLILADWLEEHGDEQDRARAEFIRLAPGRTGDPRRRELWQRYRAAWLGPLDRGRMSCSFVGGLWRLWLGAGLFFELLANGLAESETWAWVVGLKLSGLAPADLPRLLDGPLLRGLTALDLSDNALGDEGVRLLAECPHLAALTELGLDHDNIADEGAGLLAASPHLGRLTDLSLWGNHIGSAGAWALAGSVPLGRLERLTLMQNPVGSEARQALQGRFGQGLLIDHPWR